MIIKYSNLQKSQTPAATFSLMQELDVCPEKTQRPTNIHLVFDSLVSDWIMGHKGKKPVVVDIGAGQGANVRNLEAKGIKVIAVEPSANPKKGGLRKPEHRFSSEVPHNIADLIFNSYVLNVVPEDIAIGIIQDIGNILKPGGQALIITRGSDVAGAKAITHPEYGLLEWGPLEKITKSEGKLTYQKGFILSDLINLITKTLPGFSVEKYKGSNSSSVKVLLTKPNKMEKVK